jgi:hypothetical protein
VVEAAPVVEARPVVEAAPEALVEAGPVVEAAPEALVEAAPEALVEAGPVVEAAPEALVEAGPVVEAEWELPDLEAFAAQQAEAPAAIPDESPPAPVVALAGALADEAPLPTPVIATPESYAAARASQAARMLGPRWQDPIADPERVREELHIPPVEAVVIEAPRPPAGLRLAPLTAFAPEPMPVVPAEKRHRRGLVAVAGLTVAAILAAAVLLTSPLPQSGPASTPTRSESVEPSAVAVVATATPSPTPTRKPTPRPTPKPTPRPTPKPTAKPTPKPSPKLSAAWLSIVATPVPPTFKISTLSGAVCVITRVRVGGTTPHASPSFTADGSGVATLSGWNAFPWSKATSYNVTATCTLNSKSASTPTKVVAIP